MSAHDDDTAGTPEHNLRVADEPFEGDVGDETPQGRRTIGISAETFARLQARGTSFRSSIYGTPEKVILALLDLDEEQAVEGADEVEVSGWDEDGFHFSVTGLAKHRFRVTNTDVARSLLRVAAELKPWVDEHDHEYAAYIVATPEDRAEVLGIALDLDPAEIAREGADLSRKADRENR